MSAHMGDTHNAHKYRDCSVDIVLDRDEDKSLKGLFR